MSVQVSVNWVWCIYEQNVFGLSNNQPTENLIFPFSFLLEIHREESMWETAMSGRIILKWIL
jgi:hypothetical protein